MDEHAEQCEPVNESGLDSLDRERMHHEIVEAAWYSLDSTQRAYLCMAVSIDYAKKVSYMGTKSAWEGRS